MEAEPHLSPPTQWVVITLWRGEERPAHGGVPAHTHTHTHTHTQILIPRTHQSPLVLSLVTPVWTRRRREPSGVDKSVLADKDTLQGRRQGRLITLGPLSFVIRDVTLEL